jgi:CsoR family transcriptional regulator, copper-sensing transcriptional repressor
MDMSQEQVLTRLRKVEGQVRGLQRMVSDGRDCEAILTQLMAARAALDKIALSVAGQHLDQCVGALLDQPDGKVRILRAMELFLKFGPSVPAQDAEQHAEEGPRAPHSDMA